MIFEYRIPVLLCIYPQFRDIVYTCVGVIVLKDICFMSDNFLKMRTYIFKLNYAKTKVECSLVSPMQNCCVKEP